MPDQPETPFRAKAGLADRVKIVVQRAEQPDEPKQEEEQQDEEVDS